MPKQPYNSIPPLMFYCKLCSANLLGSGEYQGCSLSYKKNGPERDRLFVLFACVLCTYMILVLNTYRSEEICIPKCA